MNIKITGKELKATDAIKNYIDTKAERIEKYFDAEDINLFVTIKKEGGDQVAEMQISVNGESFRAVTASNDLYASIDKDIDILEGQIRKYKTRLNRKSKDNKLAFNLASIEPLEDEEEDVLVKTKTITPKPMDMEEAIMQMELIGHSFFVYRDTETDAISIVYRRNDGDYGLIETE